MAEQRHISVSFSVGILLLLTSYSPLSTVAEEDGEGSGGSEWEGDGSIIMDENTPITWKYELMWTKSSIKTPVRSGYYFDIESKNCTIDANCTATLPGLEEALDYDSDLAYSPYCNTPDDASNATTPSYSVYKCTCGKGLCVSRTLDSGTDMLLYYCGQCGYVGSECMTTRCDHELAECRDGYCECIQEGTYYDMTYCYIPFYGQEILINVLIATSILLLCCATLAYGYHKLGNRNLRRTSLYSERGSGTGRRESPPDDTPPAYDDVIEKLPSYQDAIQMFEKGDAERGLTNPAFEGDEPSTQTSMPDQDSTTTAVVIVQRDAEGQNDAAFEDDMTSPPSYEDTTTTTPQINPLASPPLPGVNPSTSLPQAGDIASFPQSSAREGSASQPAVKDEQRAARPQPIELILHDTLHAQHTTTSL
ncbi:uncharacterized protein LOC127005306 [Eriocheir sinensis]|uniref:uncharacterized protein LOC127005306 n=1 Tax=Eriocheir sinensis TaxID=95602 RepID=UPI0021C96EE0|nr:uncharacterized protein LOC127005306 [Eriocheir sinensis]